MTKENILLIANQHPIILIQSLIIFWLPLIILSGLSIWQGQYLIAMILIIGGIGYSYLQFHTYKSSQLIISNQKLLMKVKNGLFKSYEMVIYFSNIKDFAYTRNHFLHTTLDYGNFWARSGSGKEAEFYVPNIENISYIYNIVDKIYTLPTDKRQHLSSLDSLTSPTHSTITQTDDSPHSHIDTIIKKLQNVKGIKQVITVKNNDIQRIAEHEEDRNHGVYEVIRRKNVICITHDEKFRHADSDIVLSYGQKVIFPAVPFHEIHANNVVSGSPSSLVHRHLSKLFPEKLDELDATILIGFE